MENKQLETLSQEQLADVITNTLKELSDAHSDVMNTAYLWGWVSSEQQEACCRSLADGLDIAKQMLNKTISATTPKNPVD